jgi:hypothetical protein
VKIIFKNKIGFSKRWERKMTVIANKDVTKNAGSHG